MTLIRDSVFLFQYATLPQILDRYLIPDELWCGLTLPSLLHDLWRKRTQMKWIQHLWHLDWLSVLCFWIWILYALSLLIVQDQEIRIDTEHGWALWAACPCVLKEWWDQEPLSGSCSGHGTHLLQWQPWFQSFWRQTGAPGHLPALHLLLPSLLSSLYCPFASFLQIPERSKR